MVEALSQIDAVEELYEVTGEYDIVTLVYASDIEELSDILKNKIMKIKGVKSTITSIALSPQKGHKMYKTATETTVSDNKNPM